MSLREQILALCLSFMAAVTVVRAEVRTGEEGCGTQARTEAARLLKQAIELADRADFEQAHAVLAAIVSPEGATAESRVNGGCPIGPWVWAETAVLDLREGHTTAALAVAEKVNDFPAIAKMLSRQALGMNWFVLGAGYAAANQFEKAERAYRKSLTLPAANAQEEYARTSRIYSDLCFIYMQAGRLREAEESIRKSIETGQRANSKPEYVLRMDTLAHLHLEQGRLSEAVREAREQAESYGADKELTLNLRAHLYRDYGEVCYQLHRLDESAEYLQKSLELEERTNGSPDTGMTLVTLAQVHTLRKRYDLAEVLVQKAELRMQPFAADYPTNAAQVAVAAGDCWQAQGRWEEARAAYARGMAKILPVGSPAMLVQRCLAGAAAAAHHLGHKAEEKQLKSQLKELLASASARPANVVDVLDLKSGKSAF